MARMQVMAQLTQEMVGCVDGEAASRALSRSAIIREVLAENFAAQPRPRLLAGSLRVTAAFRPQPLTLGKTSTPRASAPGWRWRNASTSSRRAWDLGSAWRGPMLQGIAGGSARAARLGCQLGSSSFGHPLQGRQHLALSLLGDQLGCQPAGDGVGTGRQITPHGLAGPRSAPRRTRRRRATRCR